ncbi:hypothetical protein FYJ43_01385 [Cutibacterium sp. WCA-380-WT-3A]|uniref:Uncharacterized protein n=1 Tax=Cutibacterium porci TaxID=2605781 RepID=A0A7K0J474_9ACTN|nr:hypothetical protein [Cutibacterium porci]
MLTRSSLRSIDLIVLTDAVALGLIGVCAWVILKDSSVPLAKSLGIPVASWLVAVILGLILRPFPNKRTGKVDAREMKSAVTSRTFVAFSAMTWPALILYVLAFVLPLPRASAFLGMIAHGVTLLFLLRPTDQRLERFAETWCGDDYDPANPEIDSFLHGTRSVHSN